MQSVRLFSVCLLLLSAAGASAQGLYWKMTTTHKSEKEETAEFWYAPKKYKVVPAGGMTSILRLDQEKIVILDNEKKQYQEMSFDEMEGMMKGMGEAMKEMEKQLDQLPPEQRKMMEEMMGKKAGKKPAERAVDVVKSGETKTINGYSCAKYLLKRGGEQEAVIWATKDIGISGATWKEMWKDMEQFGKRMAAMAPEGAENLIDRSWSHIDGFPIRTEMNDGTVMTVRAVEKRNLSPKEFEVPAGYRKEKSPMRHGEQE